MKISTRWSIARFVFSSFVCWLAASRAAAHEPFDLSSRITIFDDRLELVSTLGSDGMRQLLSAAGLSPDEIADNLKARGPDVPVEYPRTFASRFFELKNNGEPLIAKNVRCVSEGVEIILTLTFPRPVAGTLEVRATCYEAIPGLRKGVLTIHDESVGQLGAAMLSPARVQLTVPISAASLETKTPTSTLAVGGDPDGSGSSAKPAATPSAPPVRPSFRDFFKLGVEHIWSGIDHLLFLAALLIGVRKGTSMLGIITCFTLAHSLTLALAALNVVSISSRIVEPLIAASIIIVCIANFIHRNVEADRVLMAGGFGLIHGFGFATALRETSLGQGGLSIAMPLFSFNLGVEVGQLMVAAIFLPLLVLVRRWSGFARYGTPTISACVLLVSGYWLLQRTFF
jgi:hypothetical protein